MAAAYSSSQSCKPERETAPVPYTGNPFLLCCFDVRLFTTCFWSIPGTLLPWNQWQCGELDELYPSVRNIFTLTLHGFLLVLQSVFIVSLPFLVFLPVWAALLYVSVVLGVTRVVCFVLNGRRDVLHSAIDLGDEGEQHPEESWIFLNGVSVGHHWLQSNLDRLALTFRRPIVGVHNRTGGILFDLIQCIVERNFCYATADIRRSYVTIKTILLNEDAKKVVLILHSQGGIEGGLILDWLLSELPHDTINKLEIYTFGSAANHFNNPPRFSQTQHASETARNPNAVRHIEHYAADGEFVARWGVLTFARLQNRYMGRVFIRPGSGHLLNQHYLNAIFPLDECNRVREHNEFIDLEVTFTSDGAEDDARERYLEGLLDGEHGSNGIAIVEDRHDGVEPLEKTWAIKPSAVRVHEVKPRVREYSRLWCYRNGLSPKA